MDQSLLSSVITYHEATKHHYHRFARGPGYMDWANQPDPFRRYSESPLIYLPTLVRGEPTTYQQMFVPDSIIPKPITAEALSAFFELSLAVSAWKQAGDSRWALRSNPSSGNLHPTEGYLITGEVEGIHSSAGVYHYAPREHGLELRTEFSESLWQELMRPFPPDAFLVGLSSIHWREAWKYGERAFRYCQHDIGHALASLRVAAAVLGWGLAILEQMSDSVISSLLGLDREADFKEAEREHPDLVAVVFPRNSPVSFPLGLDPGCISAISGGTWRGIANRLSTDRIPWEAIDSVAQATFKHETPETALRRWSDTSADLPVDPGRMLRAKNTTARQIIRQRRSAVAFDGVTSISLKQFYRILAHVRHDHAAPAMPWEAIPWRPKIDLCLYVHRIRELPSGIYYLVRDPERMDRVRKNTRSEFLWKKPKDCPKGLDLFLLQEGNYQRQAAQVSCTQEIAGQSAFSLGMIADFLFSLKEYGPWFYRRLFWESGMVGQMLYLAAEEAGIRATGIGCYFDDPVHGILGFDNKEFQSLYHFTMGGAVEDTRLTTHPAYSWSCEVSGRFISRNNTACREELRNHVMALSQDSVVSWKDHALSRIGVGLAGFSSGNRDHRNVLQKILNSGFNVIETSPDETEGRDELFAGDQFNHLMETDRLKPKGLFVISRGGLIRGNTDRLVEEMKRRGRPFQEMVKLDEIRRFCMHPGFLNDQMQRSTQRLGVGAIDMFMVRIPDALPALLGKEDLQRRMRQAALFLQKQCDLGNLLGFGFSAQGLLFPPDDPKSLSIEEMIQELKDLPGFGAVEVHANFMEYGDRLTGERHSGLAPLARDNGLLVLVGSPLRASFEGRETILAEFPGDGFPGADQEKNKIHADINRFEAEVHETALADGRTVAEVFRGANIKSPFQLKAVVAPFLDADRKPGKGSAELEEVLQQAIFYIRTLGGQLSQGGLWDSEDLARVVRRVEDLFSRVRYHCKAELRRKNGEVLTRLRQQYFPGADPEDSLQALGLRWLLKNGADIVLTGLRHPNYVEDARRVLQYPDPK